MVAFGDICIKKKWSVGRKFFSFNHTALQSLCLARKSITKQKDDTLSLLQYISPVYHSFYKNLLFDVPTMSQEQEDDDDELV
jgi:hypothetical protein